MHERHHVIDIMPIVNPAMSDRPAAFVIATDDFGQIAMEILPEPLKVSRTEVEITLEIVGIELRPDPGMSCITPMPPSQAITC